MSEKERPPMTTREALEDTLKYMSDLMQEQPDGSYLNATETWNLLLNYVRLQLAALDSSPPSLPTAAGLAAEVVEAIPQALGMVPDSWPDDGPGLPPSTPLPPPPPPPNEAKDWTEREKAINKEGFRAGFRWALDTLPEPSLPTAREVLDDIATLLDTAVDAKDLHNTLLDYVTNMRELASLSSPEPPTTVHGQIHTCPICGPECRC